MVNLRVEIARLASNLPRGSHLRRELAAVLGGKTALLKDGPVGRVLDQYWNTLHDLEADLSKVLGEYDIAASYPGDAKDDAKAMMKKIEAVQKAIEKITSDSFHDLVQAESKFVGTFGEPDSYAEGQRRSIFPRAAKEKAAAPMSKWQQELINELAAARIRLKIPKEEGDATRERILNAPTARDAKALLQEFLAKHSR